MKALVWHTKLHLQGPFSHVHQWKGLWSSSTQPILTTTYSCFSWAEIVNICDRLQKVRAERRKQVQSRPTHANGVLVDVFVWNSQQNTRSSVSVSSLVSRSLSWRLQPADWRVTTAASADGHEPSVFYESMNSKFSLNLLSNRNVTVKQSWVGGSGVWIFSNEILKFKWNQMKLKQWNRCENIRTEFHLSSHIESHRCHQMSQILIELPPQSAWNVTTLSSNYSRVHSCFFKCKLKMDI